MKVIIFNNTSKYHKGCAKVMDYIHNNLISNNHQIIDSVFGNGVYNSVSEYKNKIEMSDAVIVNGEGTMHHDAPHAHKLLDTLRYAKRRGKKTFLINTVWQAMSIDNELKEVLQDTYISVREIISQKELMNSDIKSHVNIDLSFFNDVTYEEKESNELITGKFFFNNDYRVKDVPFLDIFVNEWDFMVNTLRSTNWFITGRHHELYAAAKAKCKFLVLKGNTWKNEGLIETAGVSIPVPSGKIDHNQIPYYLDMCKERELEYVKFFDWMHKQPKFEFKL
jgi:hypothetical protein